MKSKQNVNQTEVGFAKAKTLLSGTFAKEKLEEETVKEELGESQPRRANGGRQKTLG